MIPGGRAARFNFALTQSNRVGVFGMEVSSTPAQPRSVFRRLLPWTAALGLFAGGGYGVYRYAAPLQSDYSASAASSATADSTAAAEQIKNLFSSPATAEATSTSRDRYASQPAPVLPPARVVDEVETPRSAAAVTNVANPFSTTPVGGGSDRYGSLPAKMAPPSEPVAEVAAPPEIEPVESAAPAAQAVEAPAVHPAADEPTEIARGQEPSSDKPLRSASRGAAAATPSEAAAAFDEQQASQPQTLDLGARLPAKAVAAVTGAAAATAATVAQQDGARYGSSPSPQLGPTPSAEDAEPTFAESTSPAPAPAFNRQPSPNGFQPTEVEPRIADASAAATPLRAEPRGGSVAAPEVANLQPGDGAITPTPGIAAVDGEGRPGDRLLEGLQSPMLAMQKLVPAEIQVGRKCTFAVRVQNTGQRTAFGVQVRDEVPLGTQLVGAAPKATVSGSQVIWDLGTLGVGEERIVEMELMPTDEGELGSVATVTFAAQASAKVRSTRPELALRLAAAPRVMLGQQHIVEIEVSNPGTGDATNVVLLETVPDGVSHEAGPALEYPIGTLAAGETKRVEIVLTAEHAGKINNVMTARADANLQIDANCEFEVIAPSLEVTVEGPKQRYLERPATYTVSVDNPGTATAKELQIVTQLPKGLQFVSANNLGEYDAATHSVYWALAELPANSKGNPEQMARVEVTTLPVEPGEHKLEVATRAQQGLEDRAEAHVKVEGLVALSFEVKAADGAIEVGGETTYEVTVVNQGSKAAANVQVVAKTPPGIRPASGAGESRHEVHGDRIVFAPVAQLAPKAEAKFRIKVQGVQAGDQRTQVEVMTDEVRDPITKEVSTQVYADQ
jgi:uncharacterized repeat protein (TIGR01451 family)